MVPFLKASYIGKIVGARNHQACKKCGVMHQVNPQFRPGGRKKLGYGLVAHHEILLFHQLDWFYRKKEAVLLIFFLVRGDTPRTPRFLLIFICFSIYKADTAVLTIRNI